MNLGKAFAIFKQINSTEFTEEEKTLAIYEVMESPTHMSITKQESIEVIKYLWNQAYKISEVDSEEVQNG